MDIQRLRRETAEDHRRVEGSVPLMEQSLDQTQYVTCLRRMYGIVAAWEEHSDSVAPEWLHDSLSERRRGRMLDRDLAWFQSSPPQARAIMPPRQDVPSLLGVMYVMEGSALGGQFIARHVETVLGLQRGFGNAYFVGHGDRTGAMWRGFCHLLTDKVDDADTGAVVDGAKAMFATFGLWMQGTLEPHGS